MVKTSIEYVKIDFELDQIATHNRLSWYSSQFTGNPNVINIKLKVRGDYTNSN